MRANTITIVVPCYNEETTLNAFMEEIQKVQKQMPDNVILELLFINDGSQDSTLSLIKQLKSNNPDRIEYLSFSRNFGKEAAILAGLEHAQGEWVALIDADLQDPPQLLVEMYQTLRDGNYDMIGTKRVSRAGEPVVRSFFANIFYRLNNIISDVHLEDGARDYRLMTRPVVEAVLSLPETNRFSKGIFSWVGFETKYLEFEHIDRSAGESSWSFANLFDYAIEGLISFSEWPLNFASLVGFISFLGASIYGIYIFIRTLIYGSTTQGWPSLVILIIGMGGLQLLSLGIVGKYIAKIFIESKHRPKYLIRESSLNQTQEE